MTIEEAIYDYLKSEKGITGIVKKRIYPMVMPQGVEMPAISYQMISGVEHHDKDVAYPRFQFSCWSKTYSEAKKLAGEIKAAFQRFKGIMGDREVIQGVFLNDIDLYDPDTGIYHVPVDIKLIYQKE